MEAAAPSDLMAGDVRRTIERLLGAVRWVILAAMLLITLAWPIASRVGYPLWPFVLVFAGYNAAVEVMRRRSSRLASYAWVPYADLPVAALLYYMDAEPGGPLFLGFYLAVVSAALSMTPRRSLLYSAAAAGAIAFIAPTLPLWTGTDVQLRTISGRVVVLALAGVITSAIVARLIRGEARAQASRAETHRLEELYRLRTEFIASITHELRTPLTAARAGLGMVRQSAGDRLRTEERRLLGAAERNIGRLNVLIDDLLAFNQIESGTLQLERVPIDLRDVIEDTASIMQPLFDEKHQSIALDLPEALEIEGDTRRLEQVVVNLLSNAHAHTPPGTHSAIFGERQDDQVHVRFIDDGPGIPQEEVERIFDRFYRLGGSGGSGLGLAIARSLIELHGGRLWAERGNGGGVAFNLVLPAGARAARAATAATAATGDGPKTPRTESGTETE